MIYDYNHYNDPKKGNKHIYATHITENGMIMAVYC